MPANMSFDVENQVTELKSFRRFYDLPQMVESQRNETIFKQVSKLTRDPVRMP